MTRPSPPTALSPRIFTSMKCLQRALIAVILLMFGNAALAADLSEIDKNAQAYRARIVAAAAGLDTQLIDSSVTDATEAEQNGRFAEAASKLKQAIGLGRETGAAWWKLSELEEKAGALDNA